MPMMTEKLVKVESNHWMLTEGNRRRCLSCSRRIDIKPVNCPDPRHQDYYEKVLVRVNRFRQAHPNLGRIHDRKHFWRIRLRVIEKLGGKCVGCGVADPRILNVNHKNGEGRKELVTHRSNVTFYRRILDGERPTADLDLRCCNCNILYEYERGRLSIPS